MPSYKTLHLLGMPIAFGLGLLIGTNSPVTTEPTYQFIVTATNGNEYVMDYDLTKTDCQQRLRDYGDFDDSGTKGIECLPM